MSVEKVRQYLTKFGIADRIQEFDVSSATVELAAQALSCEPKRIAKTMAFKLKKQENQPVLIVTSGDSKIDNPKFKSCFGEKATMLPADEVADKIGYAVGGVCPFDVNVGVKVYLDTSLQRFETVFPACGSSNSAIELTIPELEKYVDFVEWVDICKGWE